MSEFAWMDARGCLGKTGEHDSNGTVLLVSIGRTSSTCEKPSQTPIPGRIDLASGFRPGNRLGAREFHAVRLMFHENGLEPSQQQRSTMPPAAVEHDGELAKFDDPLFVEALRIPSLADLLKQITAQRFGHKEA